MAKIVTTVNKIKTELELPASPGGFTVMVHQPGIRVDVPEFVEVNGFKTIETINKLNQAQWEWMSTGDLFKVLFNIAFDGCDIEIPEDVEDVKSGDLGIAHIAGLIILGCEAMFEQKNVFFRTPEDHLHPKVERQIVGMFKAMLRLCGRSGTVTAEGEPPDDDSYTESKINEQIEKLPKDKPDDRAMAVKWLEAYARSKGADTKFVRFPRYNVDYTIGELIEHTRNDTEVGKMLVELYLSKMVHTKKE